MPVVNLSGQQTIGTAFLTNTALYLGLMTQTTDPSATGVVTVGSGVTEITGTGYARASLPAGIGSGKWTLAYTFTVTALTLGVQAGAVYTNNSKSFTVLQTANPGATSIICYGTGAPSGSGTLTYSSGTTGGDTSVTFSANSQATNLWTYPQQLFTAGAGGWSSVNGSFLSLGSGTTDVQMSGAFPSLQQGSYGAGDTFAVLPQYQNKDNSQ